MTEEEFHEATLTYNRDQTLLIIPLSTGRTAIFNRRMELIGIEEGRVTVTRELYERYLRIMEERRKERERKVPERMVTLEELGL